MNVTRNMSQESMPVLNLLQMPVVLCHTCAFQLVTRESSKTLSLYNI